MQLLAKQRHICDHQETGKNLSLAGDVPSGATTETNTECGPNAGGGAGSWEATELGQEWGLWPGRQGFPRGSIADWLCVILGKFLPRMGLSLRYKMGIMALPTLPHREGSDGHHTVSTM